MEPVFPIDRPDVIFDDEEPEPFNPFDRPVDPTPAPVEDDNEPIIIPEPVIRPFDPTPSPVNDNPDPIIIPSGDDAPIYTEPNDIIPRDPEYPMPIHDPPPSEPITREPEDWEIPEDLPETDDAGWVIYQKEWDTGEFRRAFMWFGNEDYDQGSLTQIDDADCYFSIATPY